MKILVLNSGSSSLKYQLFDSETEQVLAKGYAERIGLDGGLINYQALDNDKSVVNVDMPDHDKAMDHVFELLTDPEKGAVKSIDEISAVGHRVVHGGEKFKESVIVNEEMVNEIDQLSSLAPLHNPPNLKGIRACMKAMPGVPQIAVFDTAFHATMPDYAYTYALPYKYYTDNGVRRYGFHGTSHRFVTRQAQKLLAEAGYNTEETCVITCHLGNGCSMAAVKGGKVVDTSMGMTPAEGLMMGTRAGDLDPAILIHLSRELGCSIDEIDNIINKKSGLLGVSGLSSDMRDIEDAVEAGNKLADLALNIFCYRIKKYIGAYVAAMGGLDAVVFTGGIGERSPTIREMVCKNLKVLGIELDDGNNDSLKGKGEINKPESRVKLLVIPTNEELMIARETAQLVG